MVGGRPLLQRKVQALLGSTLSRKGGAAVCRGAKRKKEFLLEKLLRRKKARGGQVRSEDLKKEFSPNKTLSPVPGRALETVV